MTQRFVDSCFDRLRMRLMIEGKRQLSLVLSLSKDKAGMAPVAPRAMPFHTARK